MNSLLKLMLKQFVAQQHAYFQLMKEVDGTRAEIAKVSERMELLSRLLALDGKKVLMPESLASPAIRRRRAT
jgi:hypothetical protein